MANPSGMPGMPDISGALNTQISLLSQLPNRVVNSGQAAVGFAIVDTVQGSLLDLVPSIGGGLPGRIYTSVIRGFVKVIQFSTWDLFKNA